MGKERRIPGRKIEEGDVAVWTVLVESESRGSEKVWRHKCGVDIVWKEVPLSHRDGLFPFSGSGTVRQLPVPYCPKCEQEPIDGTYYSPNLDGSGSIASFIINSEKGRMLC